MPFTYPTVTISGNTYNVYCNLADANAYLGASIASAAQTWRSSDTVDDDRNRCLVSATRWLDSVTYLGALADTAQAQLFPRTGIPNVDSASIPLQIKNACCELAAVLIDDNDRRADLSGPMLKTLKAGSVDLEYFRPEGGTQVQTPFPANVMAMLTNLLGGSAVVGSLSYDTCERSHILDDRYDFNHGI